MFRQQQLTNPLSPDTWLQLWGLWAASARSMLWGQSWTGWWRPGCYRGSTKHQAPDKVSALSAPTAKEGRREHQLAPIWIDKRNENATRNYARKYRKLFNRYVYILLAKLLLVLSGAPKAAVTERSIQRWSLIIIHQVEKK